MIKRYLIITCIVLSSWLAYSQAVTRDSIPPVADNDLGIDSIDYDELFNELGFFLDSILSPRSFFTASLSVNQGSFSFISGGRVSIQKRNIWTPGLGYYSKRGLGISVTGNVINDGRKWNLYQASVSPSYDYLKNRNIATGVSYLRYFTKDSLPFYTSPLQNEIYGYFLWRKPWLQPGVTVNYGWGSRTEYKKIEKQYEWLLADAVRRRLLRRLLDSAYVINTANRQSIVDITVSGSLRHDFYWLKVFSDKDYIRLTPLLLMNAGTQKFGFNQTTTTYFGTARTGLLYNTGTREKTFIQDFKVLSLSLYLRGEYTLGKFFLQPQVIFDYYFPASEDNFSTIFSVNAGFTF